MSPSQVPLGQAAPALVPPGQYQPTAQFSQTALLVGVGGAVWRVPAAHRRTSVHEVELIMFE
jgi:hypothetical protein